MEKTWTPNQHQAIFARGGTILVSAAAGSGKTAVLVQRVIEKITDKENPCDIDRLLIVTFTKAAAAEMKERIAEKISELIEKHPEDLNLHRQQVLLSSAKISTIHRFCNWLVKENFYKLGISADFRIADDNELAILREDAVHFAIEQKYAQEDPQFLRLVEHFSTGKNDKRLIDMVYAIYDFISSYPFPETWLQEKLAMYDISAISRSKWAETIFSYAREALDYCLSLENFTRGLLEEDQTIKDAYKEAFDADIFALEGLKRTLNKRDWSQLSIVLDNFSFAKLKALRGYKEDPLKIKICANRDLVKSAVAQIKKLFLAKENQCIEEIAQLRPIIAQLFDLVLLFSKKFAELKTQKKIVDFSDLEHFTVQLLVEKSSDKLQRTPLAQRLAEQFEEIMVDEYQDTNETQDLIFRAISRREENLFVVGDVKQSIYRFRQAMPEIFLKRKNQYALYRENAPQFPAKIILDKNFRSSKGITSAVNFVFRRLMSEQLGDMTYTREEELVAGSSATDEQNIPATQVHIIDLQDDDMATTEARHIADIINQKICDGMMIQEGGAKRNVTYRDFCILLRSANKHAATYARELELCGIPVWADTTGEFFKTAEISTALALLRVVDNPIQDIPLLGVLTSPIFGFSSDKLAQIRLCDRNVPFYLNVVRMAQHGDAACAYFLALIEELRRICATSSLEEFINALYEKTGYSELVQTLPNGAKRLSNLRLLAAYARNYENSGNLGLAGFLKFIGKLENKKIDLSASATFSETANVVRIMSIHRSKGLEFPVCILAGCARKFNKDRDEMLLHPALGIGVKCREVGTMVQYPTLPKEAIALEMEKDALSEELRILYVAMTRAKHALLLITSLKKPQDTLRRLSEKINDPHEISPYVVRNSNSFSDWLLLCALQHPSGHALRECTDVPFCDLASQAEPWGIQFFGRDGKVKEISKETEKTPEDGAYAANCDEAFLEKIKKRLNFEYPFEALHSIPTKISVSELVGESTAEDAPLAKATPVFMQKEKISAAQRGTAFHAFLQFADYRKARGNAKQEIARLCENGFITREQAQSIDVNKAKKLFSSELMARILASGRFAREYRFTVDIKDCQICEFQANGQTVILQGAVDCAFLEDGEIVIVDYKTDYLKSEDDFLKKYKKQLDLYKYALEQCLRRPVKECLIYSVYLGKTIIIA